MKALTFFILGIVFIQWVTPLGDSLIELIVTAFEALKGRLGVTISRFNKAISDISEGEIETHVIGFQVDNEPEEEEDDEYDDD